MEVRTPLIPSATAANGEIDAATATAIAEDYLLMKVGDLLGATDPRLAADGRWVLTITLGNALRGTLGEVGMISVDATTGEVCFPEEERRKVEERAWELSGASSS